MQSSDDDNPSPPPPQPTDPDWYTKGGLFGAADNLAGLDPNVLALLAGTHWTSNFTNFQFDGSDAATRITYSFPQEATAYSNYASTWSEGQAQVAAFQPVSAAQESAIGTALSMISSFTQLSFVPATSSSANDSALRFSGLIVPEGQKAPPSTGGYPPQSDANAEAAGDLWLSSNGDVGAQYFGSDGFLTITHELGHTLGLKHGQETVPNGALAPQFNDNEFSVMTYASYLGSNLTSGPTSAVDGSSPQSYMMFDIAALQSMYGANFGKVGTAETYTWDSTGQEYVNGAPAPNTGVSSTHKIFSTIWTAGSTSTYDLSNFSQNQVDDMRPGHWMTFSNGQLAQLNSADPNNSLYLARGNIYNALLYNNDLSSEISNLKTGSGNDTITGNDKGNHIDAGAGNDKIFGGSGDDFITGGPGHDTIDTGRGYDTLVDTPANMDGDYVNNFGQYLAVEYQGIRFGLSHISIEQVGDQTYFKLPGSTLDLNGVAANGVYFADARGTTAGDMYTTVKFVPYLPSLQEGVGVAANSINGVIDRSFLTGDGNVHFNATLTQAVSSFHNELGVYRIGADGTISNVHILFGDTLNPGNTNVDLGTPGNGVQIGFFLIQNGANQLGTLPNDLSFVYQSNPGMMANANNAQAIVLDSASLGILNATIFHTLSQFNPGSAAQVLSGAAANGHDLVLGFEDTAFNASDKDFQDVVLHIHSNADLLYGA